MRWVIDGRNDAAIMVIEEIDATIGGAECAGAVRQTSDVLGGVAPLPDIRQAMQHAAIGMPGESPEELDVFQ